MDCDAVVVGAGIIGTACARALASAGMRTAIIERSAVGGGTYSHFEGNILVSDKCAGAELDLAAYSARLWQSTGAELADELGEDFPSIELDEKGGLVATSDGGAQSLLEFAAGQRAAGIDARELTVPQAHLLEPDLNPAISAAMYYPEDAHLQPASAVEALLAAARKRGVQVLEHTAVTQQLQSKSGEIVGVRTSAGDVWARHIIVAAGPWSAEVAAKFGSDIPVLPRRGVVLVTSRMSQRVLHTVYHSDYVTAVGSNSADLQTSSVVESTASATVLIGSSRQQIGFDDSLRVNVIEELAAKAIRLFPFLASMSVMRVYGGFRPFTPDHLPLIGPDANVPGPWHASGHEGGGIGLALGTAGAAQALAKGERIAVGGRVLVAGAGPFRLPVAASLVQTGSRVLGVLEANPLRSLARDWCRRPWELVGVGKKGPELAGYVASQPRNRISYRTGRVIAAAHGSDRLTSVTIVSVERRWAPLPGTEHEMAVDAVCVSHGFTPRLEVAIAAGCDLTENRFVAVAEDQQTSVAGRGLRGRRDHRNRRRRPLARRGADRGPRRRGRWRRRLRPCACREPAAGVRGIRAAARGRAWNPRRLEGMARRRDRGVQMRRGDLRGAAYRGWTTGSTSLRSLKLTSRAGLGICQGRVCGRTVEQLLADETPAGRLRDGVLSDHRPIAAPVRLGDLAAAYHRAHPDQ